MLNVDIGGAFSEVRKGLDDLFTSDEERAAAELALRKLEQQPHMIQAQTTLKEAEHPSVFVSGWRPGLGWVCVAGLGWAYVARPFAEFFVALFTNIDIALLPVVDIAALMPMVMALLGLGGLRTIEKVKKVARK